MPDYFDRGFVVRTPAWHGKAKVLDDWPGSWKEACIEAGIEWDIEVQPVWAGGKGSVIEIGPVSIDGGPSVPLHTSLVTGARSTPWKALVRDDNLEVLDIAPASYEPLTNGEFGQIVEMVLEILEPMSRHRYETMVELKGGKVLAVTLIAPAREVPGDPSPYLPYLVGWTSHDRSTACKLGATTVRVVCANTWSMADGDMTKNGTGFVLRHTANMRERAEEIAKGLQGAAEQHEAYFALAADLVTRQVSKTQVGEFVEYWIPVSSADTPRQLENTMAARAQFWAIYEGIAGERTMEGIRGTAWGVLQAAIEQKDWYSAFRSEDTLINRQLIAGSGDAKRGALASLRRVL